MGRTNPSKTKSIRASVNARKKHRQRAAALIAAVAGGSVVNYMAPHIIKTPMYDSALTGEDWLREILNGHPSRFHDNLGVSKYAFLKLVRELQMYAGLRHSKHITQEEQVAIFLHLCRTGGVHRQLRERFQHSPDTISKYVFLIILLHDYC